MEDTAVSSLIWIFTARCNLACRHCYVVPRFSRLRELPREGKLRLIDEAAELGIGYIGFSGGEPLTHPDFRELLKRCMEYGIETSVVTNAITVSDDIVRLLSDAETMVYVSIDGSKEKHEELRGEGTWDKTINGLKKLLEGGVFTATIMAVTRSNYAHSAEYIETASSLGLEFASMIPAMPTGRALSGDIYVRAHEYAEAVRRALESAEELGIRLSLWCTPFAPYIAASPRVRYYSCRLADVADLDPSGSLLLCDILDVVISRADQGLAKALTEYSRHPLVKLVTNPPELPKHCRTCSIVDFCRGGCYARSLILKGSLNAGDPLCPRVANSCT